MVTKRPSEDSLAIHATHFGGLNTTAAQSNIPSTDCTRLLNIDTDISGKLTKRKGTRILIEGTYRGSKLFNFGLNSGLNVLVAAYSNDVAIFQINNNQLSPVITFSNLFKFFNNEIQFLVVPDDHIRLVMFTERETPKQITVYESTFTPANSNQNQTVDSLPHFPNQDACDLARIFVNGVHDPSASLTYGANNLTLSRTIGWNITDKVDIILFTWQWWAEAELWEGGNFRSTVPRFGASEADKLVQVPAAINDSLEGIREPYGIKLYSRFNNDLGANEYNRVSVPSRADQYSWSNGTFSFINAQYLWDAVTTNFATRFFVNFGQESNFVEYDNIEVLDFNTARTRVRIPSHQFTDGDVIRIRQIDVAGQSTTLNRWVAVINEDLIEFHDSPDINNTLPISISYNSVENIAAADVNTSANRFEGIPNAPSKFPSGSPFKVLPDGGTAMPGGYVVDRVYYGIGGNPDLLLPYIDKNTEFRVNMSSPVDCIVYEVNPIIIFKRLFNTVTFNRARRIPFNGGDGIASLWFDVILNDFLGLARNDNLSSTGYVLLTDRNDLSSRLTNNNDLGQHIAFINPLDEDDELMLVNAENQWSGTGAKTARFTLASTTSYLGGYYPIYGFSQFADFKRGVFPSVGAFYQERIYLSGMSDNPSLVVASGISNQYKESEKYNYFQISDALSGEIFEPFDFVLNNPGNILNITVWQELLFIFTQNGVYRNQVEVTPQIRNFGLVSNSGVYVRNCTTVADNQLMYLSYNGVYAVPLVEQSEYRSQEVSIKIRDIFIENEFLGIHFHNQRKKLFLYSSTLMYVFDLLSESWTQYYTYTGFPVETFADYYDPTLGWLLASSNDLISNGEVALIRWYDNTYADYVKNVSYASDFSFDINGLSPLIEVIPVTPDKFTYEISTWMPYGNEKYVEIWYGETLATALLPVEAQINKVSKNSITLTFNPIAGRNLYIVPNVPGTWHGYTMVLQNGIPLYLNDMSLGQFDPRETLRSYDFDLSAVCIKPQKRDMLTHGTDEFDNCTVVMRNITADLGYAYPSEFSNPVYTQELLAIYKRVEEILLWFEQSSDRINFDGISRDPSDPSFRLSIEDQYLYPTYVVAQLLQNDSKRGSEESLVNSASVYNESEMVLYKSSPQRTGYAYRLYMWSVFYFNFIAYQIIARVLSGSGFISGGE